MYLTAADFVEITAEKTAHKEARYLKDEGRNSFIQTSAMRALWLSQRRLWALLSSCV
jgi:hypothetical protein